MKYQIEYYLLFQQSYVQRHSRNLQAWSENQIKYFLSLNLFSCKINIQKVPMFSLQKQLLKPLTIENLINDLQGDTIFQNYSRVQSYLLSNDWELNPDRGGIRLINEEKRKMIGKIVKFVMKKAITGFMGLNFPVFAMKPESILETYAKCIAAAPLFFHKKQVDPVERVKKFVAFTFTFSRLLADLDKPFNPVIGQTFQAMIAGGIYASEQTSHHPPQSSFFFEQSNYFLYGTLQLKANIGLNSAEGQVFGDITLQYKDGGKVIGRILSGEMSGTVIGQNKFRPQGSSYAYDPVNKIICTYKREKKDNFQGYIGLLKEKYQLRWEQKLKSNDRFSTFEAFQQKHFDKISSKLNACWTKKIQFNQKVYMNFESNSYLPFKLEQPSQILLSDSRYRQDIALRKSNLLKQSQAEKQRIENLERYFRRLRQGKSNQTLQQNQIQNIEYDN